MVLLKRSVIVLFKVIKLLILFLLLVTGGLVFSYLLFILFLVG